MHLATYNRAVEIKKILFELDNSENQIKFLLKQNKSIKNPTLMRFETHEKKSDKECSWWLSGELTQYMQKQIKGLLPKLLVEIGMQRQKLVMEFNKL